MCHCICVGVYPHFHSIKLRCGRIPSAALVLVQLNRMCGGKEGGDGRKQKKRRRRRWGCAWRGLFVTVNQPRVVHIIWPLMAAPPLL